MSESVLLASLDVGTNTLRLLIGSVAEDRVRKIYMDRAVTRLGAGLAKTGRLSTESISTSIEKLTAFKATCELHGVREIVTIGTSALRDAANSDLFLRDVELKTGLKITVISGDQEADLTVKGVVSGMEAPFTLTGHRLIVDIGGGSTEWILTDDVIATGSVPVGVVKLSETFPCHDPPSPAELHLLMNHVEEALSPLVRARDDFIKALERPGGILTEVILTGGTPTTLAAVDLGLSHYDWEKVHLHQLTLPALERMFRTITSLTTAERGRIPGLEPERADLIIAGTVLVMSVMALAGAKSATVSDYGLLEGALLDLSTRRHFTN